MTSKDWTHSSFWNIASKFTSHTMQKPQNQKTVTKCLFIFSFIWWFISLKYFTLIYHLHCGLIGYDTQSLAGCCHGFGQGINQPTRQHCAITEKTIVWIFTATIGSNCIYGKTLVFHCHEDHQKRQSVGKIVLMATWSGLHKKCRISQKTQCRNIKFWCCCILLFLKRRKEMAS